MDWFLITGFPIRFLFGPLLYLYISYYLNPDYKLNVKAKILLWGPAIIDVIFFISMCVWGAMHHYTLIEKMELINSWPFYLESGLAVPLSIFFTILSFITVRKFYQNQKKIYTNIKFGNFSWLLYILLITIVLQVIWLVCIIIDFAVNLPRDAYNFLTLLTGIQILVYGYLAILKPENTLYFRTTNNDFKRLLTEKEDEVIDISANDIAVDKNNTSLDTENLSYSLALSNRINDWMLTEKPYKNPDFALSDIVEKFNVKSSYISLALKQGSGTNFYNYINTLRAKEFLQMLTNSESKIYTITALGQLSGFTSKVTLLKYFKNITGLTPSEYLSKYNNGEAKYSIINTPSTQ